MELIENILLVNQFELEEEDLSVHLEAVSWELDILRLRGQVLATRGECTIMVDNDIKLLQIKLNSGLGLQALLEDV